MSQVQQKVKNNNVLVAMGGNGHATLGGVRETLTAAVVVLREAFDDLVVSPYYQTPAFPEGSGPDFVNAACSFRSDMAPIDILNILHGIEATFGRKRTLRWGQRTLDLDLIAVGSQTLPDLDGFAHWQSLPLESQAQHAPDRLILPHPRLQDRPFVLVPLADIAPEWRHPVTGQTVTQMRDAHSTADRADVRPLK